MLSLLPARYPSPDRALRTLPNMLRGLYDPETVLRLIAGSVVVSLVIAAIGMFCFSRRDV